MMAQRKTQETSEWTNEGEEENKMVEGEERQEMKDGALEYNYI